MANENIDQQVNQIETLINQGRFFEAHNLASSELESNPDNIRLKQLFALSMSKSGNPKDAQEYLEPIYEQSKQDPETAGILGGIYKELFVKTQNSKYAVQSRDIYLNNYQSSENHYPGINAATMSVIAGQARKGKEIADSVIETLNNKTPDFWETASLAEAYLLKKDRDKAISLYNETREKAGSDWGKINTIYAQLWLLDHYTSVPGAIMKVFSPPVIVSFAGHMVDHPGRDFSRFPSEIEEKVKHAIKSEIANLDSKIGFCSLACGADILFAESMLEEGGEVNIFLPFQKEDFVETSVSCGGETWIKRFENIMNENGVKYITNEKYLGDDLLFSFMGKVILGSAILKGLILHTEPYFMTVLSESDDGRKTGGTRDINEIWPYPERKININPDHFVPPSPVTQKEISEEMSAPPKSGEELTRKILYILFADIVGYSKISEEKSPYFVHNIWGEIASEMKELFIKPIVMNTMGGMVFSVFSSTKSTMEFALFLKDIGEKFDWKTAGLPEKLNLRIGLHAGPVYFGLDPLSGQKNAYGTHINRAAEIQLKTLPGTIYASEQFASVLALESRDYIFEHVGIVHLDGYLGPQEIYKISTKEEYRDL